MCVDDDDTANCTTSLEWFLTHMEYGSPLPACPTWAATQDYTQRHIITASVFALKGGLGLLLAWFTASRFNRYCAVCRPVPA